MFDRLFYRNRHSYYKANPSRSTSVHNKIESISIESSVKQELDEVEPNQSSETKNEKSNQSNELIFQSDRMKSPQFNSSS